MESNATQVYAAEKIFTGNEWLTDHAVIVAGGKITDIVAYDKLNEKPSVKYHLLAPAFIDVQIYGAHDKLLSVYPDTDSLHKLYD